MITIEHKHFTHTQLKKILKLLSKKGVLNDFVLRECAISEIPKKFKVTEAGRHKGNSFVKFFYGYKGQNVFIGSCCFVFKK